MQLPFIRKWSSGRTYFQYVLDLLAANGFIVYLSRALTLIFLLRNGGSCPERVKQLYRCYS